MVLKTALTIVGAGVKFEIKNITKGNMETVEDNWTQISDALDIAAKLLRQFGYNELNLTANSVIVPVAYYLYCREVDEGYLKSAADAADRLALQQWVNRLVLKRGIWGRGGDKLINCLRDVFRANSTNGFPVVAVEETMAAIGKSL